MLAPTIETAPSGRAKCRGCGEKIAKGEVRLGENLPSPYAEDSVMTLWFHPRCAAFKRPEVALAALDGETEALEPPEALRADAESGLAHRRIPRLDGAGRAPTGRARCRACRETIAKDGWRIGLVFYQEGRFEPGGFIHASCVERYCETAEVLDRVAHFSGELSPEDRVALAAALKGG